MKLDDLEGIGPARLDSLRAMGINSLRDLLFTLPVRYEDHNTVSPCTVNKPGFILVSGMFPDSLKSSYFHGLSKVSGTLYDESGKLPVCWYNEPWIAKNIQKGQTVRLYGRLTVKDGKRLLQNPKIITDSGWIPVYRSLKHFPAKTFRKAIECALDHLEDCCPETLPSSFRLSNQLCELNFALREAHFPSSLNNLEIARRRLSYESILLYLLYVSFAGKKRDFSHPIRSDASAMEKFWSSLPFRPTSAQRRVLQEISEDMKRETAMARLVQGDVGSGKTAVAFGAVFLACQSEFQCAMMAPTEILALQHFETAKALLEPLGICCRLLTGSTKAKERESILTALREGKCHVVFGTHALISKGVEFRNLGLVITDEQHRFGVRQRTALKEKGENSGNLSPHVLVMSATPIPRSLALILYGDLDISVIDELPEGRIPVKTRIVPEYKREDMYRFLKNEIKKGYQAYIVCPLVEDSENIDELRSVKTVYHSLTGTCLKDLRIAMIWGNQKNIEKEAVISDFSRGLYDILVSTTVIEVGINNPNASVMIIENAERFGLSQLHQLRGRVGRGSAESWCFLLSDNSEKLDILCRTNDGFEVSKKDLDLRGPGDLIGIRQSGETEAHILVSADSQLLEEVSRTVRMLHRDSSKADILLQLEKYARDYFENTGHGIALS